MPAGAASVFSGTAVVRSAAEDPAILVRCGPGGWGDAAASLAAVLPPGTLAVGGYYDSRSYGYSGSPPYYGDRYGAYYGCLDGYPVYYGYGPAPSYRYRSGYRHHRARPRATSAGSNGANSLASAPEQACPGFAKAQAQTNRLSRITIRRTVLLL